MLRYRNTTTSVRRPALSASARSGGPRRWRWSGRLDEACRLFERLVDARESLGLFSEDIDPRHGRLLGNFPQAYTHVGLINAAVTIGELLEARDARFRAWS